MMINALIQLQKKQRNLLHSMCSRLSAVVNITLCSTEYHMKTCDSDFNEFYQHLAQAFVSFLNLQI